MNKILQKIKQNNPNIEEKRKTKSEEMRTQTKKSLPNGSDFLYGATRRTRQCERSEDLSERECWHWGVSDDNRVRVMLFLKHQQFVKNCALLGETKKQVG